MSKAVGVRELKTRLGSYLREVRRGADHRGDRPRRARAELRPITRAKSGTGTELDRLVIHGRLTRTSNAPLAPFRPIKRKGRPLSDAIVKDREDRF